MTVRVGIIGAGKMGISHFAIVNAHRNASVVAVCDTSSYVLSVLKKYTGVATFDSYEKMIDQAGLDAVLVATPTATHFPCAKYALEKGLHLFVEKPLTLSPADSGALSDLARQRKRVNQVGFHNRFIGTFQEARRLVRAGVLGEVTNLNGSAFGQVVVKEQSSTWRSKKTEGGGCLHDYACHVVDLMNFIAGTPTAVRGARMQSVFSKDVEDAVYAIFSYADGMSGVLETNWSDETFRKMSTTITASGTKGKLVADRQELKVHLRSGCAFERYEEGWTTRYITDLQKPVDFYLRGEEYSAQIDAFVRAIESGNLDHENAFASACETDRVLHMIAAADRVDA
ncbi:MAG TPA: Gfo/Idh/MocA family oxidoreductase [Planctomycetota bacterium]|jgi:predicted dehydrogenase|nr:Gfo/Idh/MocA family oxidoreductase [Planctomycetota bacterium]